MRGKVQKHSLFQGLNLTYRGAMTRRKQSQKTLWEGIVAEDVRELWEPWMVEADKLLEDEDLIERMYDEQGGLLRKITKRCFSTRRSWSSYSTCSRSWFA